MPLSPWLSAAAGIVLFVAVAAGTWLAQSERFGRELAADVVRHILEEPQALAENRPVGATAVARALASHDVGLITDIGTVVFAETCVFRGRLIPHLVVQTPAGLVTLLVLPEERPRTPIEIAAEGMNGRVIPVLGHALAIVGQSPLDRSVEDIFIAAVEWGHKKRA
jgi:hypothetical protein